MTEALIKRIRIGAPVDVVFDHFVKPERLLRWMGETARLDPVVGGIFAVDVDGIPIRGEFRRLRRPGLVEIAWGEEGNSFMPPASTLLSIALEPTPEGAALALTHAGLAPSEMEKHAFGWPLFLLRLRIAATGGDPGPYPWTDAMQAAS